MPQVKLSSFEGIANAGFEFAVVGKAITYLGTTYQPGERFSDPANPRRMEMLFKQRRIQPVAANPSVPQAGTVPKPTSSQSRPPAALVESPVLDSATSTRKFGRRARP